MASIELDIKVKTREVETAKKKVAELTKELQNQKQALNELKVGRQVDIENLKKMEREGKKNSAQYKELKADIEETSKNINRLNIAMQGNRNELSKENKVLSQSNAELKQLTRGTEGATVSMKGLSRSFVEGVRQTKSLKGGFQALGVVMKKNPFALMAIAVVGLVAGMKKLAETIEPIRKLVDGLSNAFERAVTNISNSLGADTVKQAKERREILENEHEKIKDIEEETRKLNKENNDFGKSDKQLLIERNKLLDDNIAKSQQAIEKWNKLGRKKVVGANNEIIYSEKSENALIQQYKAEKALNDKKIKAIDKKANDDKIKADAESAKKAADEKERQRNKELAEQESFLKKLVDAYNNERYTVEQSQINAMREGGDRQLAQIELNHKKQLDAIADFEVEMIAAYNKAYNASATSIDELPENVRNMMKKIMGDRTTAAFSALTIGTAEANLTKANDKIDRLNSARSANSAGKSILGVIGLLKADIDSLNKELESATGETAEKIKETINELTDEVKKSSDELSNNIKQGLGVTMASLFEYDSASAFFENLEVDVNNLTEKLSSVGSFLEDYGDKMKGDSTNNLGSIFPNLGDKITGLGKNLVLYGIFASVTVAAALKAYKARKQAQEEAAAKAEEELATTKELLNTLHRITLEKIAASEVSIFGENNITSMRNAMNALKEYQERLKDFTLASNTERYGGVLNSTTSERYNNYFSKLGIKDWTQSGAQGLLYQLTYQNSNYDLVQQMQKELISDGRLNTSVAGSILESGLLSEERQKLLQDWYDLATLIEEQEQIMTDSISSMLSSTASSFADDMIEAFEEGTSAGEKMYSTLSDLSKNYMKELIESELILPKLQSYTTQISNAMKQGNLEMYNSILNNMHADMTGAFAEAQSYWNLYKSSAFAQGEGSVSSATAKGIAQASQDSIDELNGRFTTIQSHTWQITEMMREGRERNQTILNEIMGIHSDTQSMRANLDTIVRNGVTLR